MESKTMAGDAEAAGAIAGMIETYGTKAKTDARVFTIYVNPYCSSDGNEYTIAEYEALGLLPGGLVAIRHTARGVPYGEVFFHHIPSAGRLYHTRREAIDAVAAKLEAKLNAIGAQINKLRDLSGQLGAVNPLAAIGAVVPQVEDIA